MQSCKEVLSQQNTIPSKRFYYNTWYQKLLLFVANRHYARRFLIRQKNWRLLGLIPFKMNIHLRKWNRNIIFYEFPVNDEADIAFYFIDPEYIFTEKEHLEIE